jgi:hypothetical protein
VLDYLKRHATLSFYAKLVTFHNDGSCGYVRGSLTADRGVRLLLRAHCLQRPRPATVKFIRDGFATRRKSDETRPTGSDGPNRAARRKHRGRIVVRPHRNHAHHLGAAWPRMARVSVCDSLPFCEPETKGW